MPPESYQMIIGVVIAIIVLILAGIFIFVLVNYSNNRKKQFVREKQNLELVYNEQLLQSQLEVQEQTFNMISQEIHDNVGQMLSLAKVQVGIIDHGKSYNPVIIGELKETLSKAMSDLRDIAKSLNSERINEYSLVELTSHELQRMERIGIFETALYVKTEELPISSKSKIIVLRIIQEIFQNIMKHARASKIEVYFYFTHQHFKCEVNDNGVGFDAELTNQRKGLGLQNMRNRANLLGGETIIKSRPNEGTSIIITVPYV